MISGSFRPLELLRALVRLPGEVAGLSQEVRVLKRKVQQMSTVSERLIATVEKQISIDRSAYALIQGISTEMRKSSDETMTKLADDLEAGMAPLSAALVANTPSNAPGLAMPSATASPTPVTTDAETKPAETKPVEAKPDETKPDAPAGAAGGATT